MTPMKRKRCLRILLLNYEFPPLGGGAAPVTRDLANALARQGHSFDLVTMGFRGLLEQEQVGAITVYRVPCIRRRKEMSTTLEMLSFLLPAWKKANELLQKNNYDLIHAHFIIPTGLLALLLSKKHKIPYILSSHGSDIPGYNPDRFGLLHKLLLPIWRVIVINSSVALTPSESLRKLILKFWRGNPEKIKAINWGIDIRSAPTARKENRIVFAGRLFERKGCRYVVEACKNIDLNGWEVAIVGDGPQRQELEKLAGRNAAIKFYGWLSREKLQALYSKS